VSRHLLVALLALGLAPAPVARAGDVDDERARELEEVRRAIEQRRERVEAFERRERGLLDTLEEVDRAASRLSREARVARRRAVEARAQLAALEGREEEIAARQARTRSAMSARAVALYKTGDAGPVTALFSAGNLQEFLARSRALRLLLDHDRTLLERYASDSDALVSTRRETRVAAAENERASAVAAARAQELAAEHDSKRLILGQVRQDRASERAALQELEAAALALEETLERLRGRDRGGRGPSNAEPFASRQGRLALPVVAPVARGFGRVVDDEFRTETFRKGVDFAAAAGAAVRAVAPGEVRFAGWFRGYGRIVILDHGDGYFTVSGHLDAVDVAVGNMVGEGDDLGTVGETGSLSGPRLYFEIRQGAEPLDPAEWLESAP
jgi:septal ring factor EnvC (AmiA/AmiB activator)